MAVQHIFPLQREAHVVAVHDKSFYNVLTAFLYKNGRMEWNHERAG